MPVADSEREAGINVGVATHGQGIPVDILGQDPGKAKADLEAAGYHVTVTPHLSSKQYVGKVSGSYPAPGTTLSKGAAITLYEGVNKSSNLELTSMDSGDGTRFAQLQVSSFIGMYCKATVTDPDTDCITLEQTDGAFPGDQALQIKGHESTDSENGLELGYYGQSACNVMLNPGGDCGYTADQLPMKNHLLLKDWGMFELYAGEGLPNCGDTVWGDNMFEAYCDAGTVKSWDSNDWQNWPGTPV